MFATGFGARMYWDEEKEPSVEVPLGDFFCCGFGKECLVNSESYHGGSFQRVEFLYQMPFRKKARITLEKPACECDSCIFFIRSIIRCMISCRKIPLISTQDGKGNPDRTWKRLCNCRRDKRQRTIYRNLYRSVNIEDIGGEREK